MIVDLGTGDGRAVLRAAAREPEAFVLGIDADAASMAGASRRAAHRPAHGGLPNAGFVVAAAEALPPELDGIADLVTVRFPWGSLLRGCVGGDARIAAVIAALVAPSGSVELLLAPAARDGLPGIPLGTDAVVDAVRCTFESTGLGLEVGRAATPDEVRASDSTWARRLLGSAGTPDRAAVLVRLRRR